MPHDAHEIWPAFLARPGQATFEPLYERTKALVWTLCNRILLNEEDAGDAFQAAYARLFAEIKTSASSADSQMEGNQYLYRLAVREAGNLRMRRIRRTQREIAMDPLPEFAARATAADDLAAQKQLRGQLEALMRLLPDDTRVPLQLHYFDGLSQSEIAAIMETNQGTISRRLASGIRQLEPLARRAGLGESLTVFGSMALATGLLQPPAAFSAAAVFAHVQAALAAGLAGPGAGAFFAKHSLWTAAKIKTVTALTSAAFIVGVGTILTLGAIKRPSPAPGMPSALNTRIEVAAPRGFEPAREQPKTAASSSSSASAPAPKLVAQAIAIAPRTQFANPTPQPRQPKIEESHLNQAGNPNSVITQYLANLDKFKRYHMKFRSVSKADVHSVEYRDKAGKWTTYNDGEVFSDGLRYHAFNRKWGNTLYPSEFVLEADRGLTSYLYDGTGFLSYGVKADSDIPKGIAHIETDYKVDPEVGEVYELTGGTYSGLDNSILQGYIGEQHEHIASILRKLKVAMRQIQTPAGKGIQLEARSEHGNYTVLFDPTRGYNIIGAEVTVSPGDRVHGFVYKPPVAMHFLLHNVRLELKENIWIPMECDLTTSRRYALDETTSGEIHVIRTEVTLNPDFEKLRAFQPDEVQNGARVFFSSRNRNPNRKGPEPRLVWKDGKPVPETVELRSRP